MFTRFHRSFEPQFHPERLNELSELKKPSKIFVCSVADLFAEWTPEEWVYKVLVTMQDYPQHEYQLLTKQPRFDSWVLKNYWVGVTVNNQDDVWKIEKVKRVDAKIRFVSFEPLLGNIDCNLENLEWIIIGKLTGSRKVPLQKEWVQNLINQAGDFDIPVFIKNNVGWHEKIQEFPL
jgi:protein gp37